MIIITFPFAQPPVSVPLEISAADANRLGPELVACLNLMPGEVAQRLGAVFASMQSLKVHRPVEAETVSEDEAPAPAKASRKRKGA